MALPCIAGRHEVAPGEVRNQGFGFSRCQRCGRDMVRSKREWRTVPRGFRVVWRRGRPRPSEFSAAQLLFDLSPAGPVPIAPARKRHSRLSEILFLALTGLRFLSWAAGARLRAWRERLRTPHPITPPILRLAPFVLARSRVPTL